MNQQSAKAEIAWLQAQVATLEQLLDVYEQAVQVEAERAERQTARLRERTLQLEKSQMAALNIMQDIQKTKVDLAQQADQLRLANAQLQHERFLLQSLMDNVPDSIYFKDLQGRFLRVNRYLAQRNRLEDPAEAEGKTDFDFFPKEHAQASYEMEQRIICTGQPVIGLEERETCSDASKERWVLTSKLPLRDEQGRIMGTFGLSRDITELKRKEALLQEQAAALVKMNTQLVQSNKDLDDFAYIASHDLKEPLRGIANYAHFLWEDYAGQLDEEGREKLTTLTRLCKRMESLIDSLLKFSRLGRTELAIQRVDLNQVVSEVLDMLRVLIAEQQVEIRIPRLLPVLYCDAVRVRELYNNLITNAIKYNDKPTKWIEIGWLNELCADGHTDKNVLFVRDNGIGIAKKHHEAVFRIFKRLHARDTFGSGTGAGLTFVKQIVERHGGRIWLQSEPKKGSTFYFTLAGGDGGS